MESNQENHHSVNYKNIVLNLGCFVCCLFFMLAAIPTHAGGLADLLKNLPNDATGSASGSGLGSMLQGLTGSSGSTSSGGTKPNVSDLFAKHKEMAEKMTMGPVDHYYLGRYAASKTLGSGYLPPTHPTVQYVKSILLTLSRYSRVPYVHDDYIPIVIMDEDVNAFAAPGGFIVVTKGLLDFVQSEDELALLLAHEIGHVEHNHGVMMVQASLGAEFMSEFMGEIGAGAGMEKFADAVLKFGKEGYDVELEMEADARALFIGQQAGYDPKVFPRVMERLKKVKGHLGGKGYPPNRKELILQELKKYRYLGQATSVEFRTARFAQRMARKNIAVVKTKEKPKKKKSTGGTADDK